MAAQRPCKKIFLYGFSPVWWPQHAADHAYKLIMTQQAVCHIQYQNQEPASISDSKASELRQLR
jgi:hypothetical protein